MKVPFADLNAQYLSIKKEIDSAIANVIAETGFIGGHFVKDFEEQFANAYGVKNVIGCGNGAPSAKTSLINITPCPTKQLFPIVTNSQIKECDCILQ